ncbi:MAG: bacillithiol biosynthesis cysteine-adding enzyme BshC [Cytophagaceae bacterium]
MAFTLNRTLAFQQMKGKFSKLFVDYIQHPESFGDLLAYMPTQEGLKAAIDQRSKEEVNRTVLINAITKQYAASNVTLPFSIGMLHADTTFTITTGQQLGIGLGPLYTVLKAMACIKYAEQCKKWFPSFDFVPVFWLASEDHDKEEIQSFQVFNKTYTWDTTQTGAVGQFTTDGLSELLKQIPDFPEWVSNIYDEADNLSNATRKVLDKLFHSYGLVVVDGDDVELKRLFIPVIQKEIKEKASQEYVQKNSERLEKLGYSAQVHAREINLFYLGKGSRERIVFESGKYQVLHTSIAWSESELLAHVEEAPQLFSPNVILRPVYESVVLPDIAYVGGPGEIAYWLQLKGVFDAMDVLFPVVLPRIHASFISGSILNKIKTSGFSIEDLLDDENTIKSKVVAAQGEQVLSWDKEKSMQAEFWNAIANKVESIDKTLVSTVKAEEAKALKLIEDIEKKAKKAEERKFEQQIKSALQWKEKMFPNNGLLERSDSIWSWMINEPEIIDQLMNTELDIFQFNFFVND